MNPDTKELYEYMEVLAECEDSTPVPRTIQSLAYIFLTRWQLLRLAFSLFWLAIKPR